MTAVERAWRGGKNDWRLHLLGIFSVAVGFVCLASALLVLVNVDRVRARWAETGRASVYLQPDVTEPQRKALERALQTTPGVTDVRFVSSDAARRELLQHDPEQVLAALPDPAFPASLELTLEDEAATERLEKMSGQLRALPAVEAVETYHAFTDRLASLLGAGAAAAAALALIVFAAVISVVSSTIRLALHRRSIEVQILKLVGATDTFVRRPFLVEGAVQGAVGALLSVVIVGVLYLSLRGQFSAELALLLGGTPAFLPISIWLPMVAVGALLGTIAAFASLRKLLVV
ncbi:MAG TPA: permease-like cell division protein FtsX [Polyangiaceae bacterium]|nr:permease-like cell division protein FtsX [Polyangiaceae bacterium]